MLNVLLVGLGGFVGSVGRYSAGLLLQHLPGAAVFPYGTLAVNILGCFIIGLLAGVAELRPGLIPHEARLFLFVGLLGGFTTFSAFGLESTQLFRFGPGGLGILNVGVQVVVGLVGVWGGVVLGRQLVG